LDAVLDDVIEARASGVLEIDGVPIVPAPAEWAAVVMGGGGSATVRERGEPVRLVPQVARRIARSDGWFIRSSSPTQLWRSDLAAILNERRRLELDGAFQIFRSCFLHVSMAKDPDVALDEQMRAMRSIGWSGDVQQFCDVYPHGTVSDLQAWFRAAAGSGIGHVVLHPVGPLAEQVDHIRRHLLPTLTDVEVGSLQ
jgi:hypothetical protein